MHGRKRHRVLAIDENEPGTGQMGEQVFSRAALAAASFAGSATGWSGSRASGATLVKRHLRPATLGTKFGKVRNARPAQRSHPAAAPIQSGRSFQETARCPGLRFGVMINCPIL